MADDASRCVGESWAAEGIAASNQQRDINGPIQRAMAIARDPSAAEVVVVIAVMAAVHPMSGGFEDGAFDFTGADAVFQQQYVQCMVHVVMVRSAPREGKGLMTEGCGTKVPRSSGRLAVAPLGQPSGIHGGLSASTHTQFRQQVRHVVLDRLLSEEHALADLAVGEPLHDQVE